MDDDTHDAPPGSESLPASRRRLLGWAIAGLGALIVGIPGIPAIGFYFGPTTRRVPPVWREVGSIEEFPVGATIAVRMVDPSAVPWAGFAAESVAFVRRGESDVVAFSAYCTHVGCAVRWEEGASLFLCPCHGGAFHRDGTVASGPPPRPLVRHEARIRDGRVEVRLLALQMPG